MERILLQEWNCISVAGVKFSRELAAFNVPIFCGRQKEMDEIATKLWGDRDKRSMMKQLVVESCVLYTGCIDMIKYFYLW